MSQAENNPVNQNNYDPVNTLVTDYTGKVLLKPRGVISVIKPRKEDKIAGQKPRRFDRNRSPRDYFKIR